MPLERGARGRRTPPLAPTGDATSIEGFAVEAAGERKRASQTLELLPRARARRVNALLTEGRSLEGAAMAVGTTEGRGGECGLEARRG